MAYDVNHLLTVGAAKTVFDATKVANNAIGRFDNTSAAYNTINRGNIVPQSAYDWHFGGINSSNGSDLNNSPSRMRSVYMPAKPSTLYIIKGGGYVGFTEPHYYKSDKTFISGSSWYAPGTLFTTPANCRYIRFLLKKDSSNTDFTTDDFGLVDLACYPLENDLGQLQAQGLNDIFRDFATPRTMTTEGVTFTWDPDKWEFTINGTSTASGSSANARGTIYDNVLPAILKPHGVYKLVQVKDDENIGIYFSFLDAGGSSLWSFTSYEAESFIVVPTNAKRLWVRAQTKHGSTVTNKVLKFRLEYQEPATDPIHIPVMAYNVGAYNHGYAPSDDHTPPATSQTLSQLKEFFRTHQADIIATEEGQELLLDTDLTTQTDMNSAIYNYQWPYYATSISAGAPYSPSLHSRYPFIWKSSWNDSAGRPFAMAIINVHGIPVMVAAIHFATTAQYRDGEFESIITRLQSYGCSNHYIVMGDFNAGNDDASLAAGEYQDIIDAGYHSANGGWWGLFNTYNPSNPLPIDSVVTTENIDIVTYDVPSVYNSMPSDHLPLCCDLVLYPDNKLASRN